MSPRPVRTVWALALGLGLLLWAGCAGSESAAPGETGDDTTATVPGATDPSAGESGAAARPPTDPRQREPVALAYEIVATYPHDTDAFTQGLLVHDGSLYEGTGRHGLSELREVEIASGRVLRSVALEERYFGEGLALVPGGGGAPARLVQLTWQSNLAFVWAVDDLRPLGEHTYQGEGWGLTFDGERLVMSDGSSWLSFRDPESFEETGRVQVVRAGLPVPRLNELEWVDGEIWANLWSDDRVVRIDPATGAVTGELDLSGLWQLLPRRAGLPIDVLNGIAHWPERGTLLVTGKLWPLVFELEIRSADG